MHAYDNYYDRIEYSYSYRQLHVTCFEKMALDHLRYYWYTNDIYIYYRTMMMKQSITAQHKISCM